jgi:hypothetical protein
MLLGLKLKKLEIEELLLLLLLLLLELLEGEQKWSQKVQQQVH